MKILAFLSLLVLCGILEPAQACPKPGDSIGELTAEGKRYTSCTLIKIEPDGITISHSDGMAKLYFSRLSGDIQKKFSFDPKKAERYAADLRAKEQANYENFTANKNQTTSPGIALPPTILERRSKGTDPAKSRAKLDQFLSERRQEEQAYQMRREESNDRTKERIDARKKTKKKR